MQATLEEVQNLVNRLTFLDKVRLLAYLAPLVTRSATAIEAPSVPEDILPKPTEGLGYSVNPNRDAMKKEISAYHQMHSELVATHFGEYVAVYQSQIVDHDGDPVRLHKRIKTNFPNKVVLSRKVGIDPEPTIHMRSPRLERIS